MLNSAMSSLISVSMSGDGTAPKLYSHPQRKLVGRHFTVSRGQGHGTQIAVFSVVFVSVPNHALYSPTSWPQKPS
jgi:hypothetical protein